MSKNIKLNVDQMFESVMDQTNALILVLKKLDPASEAYGIALANLAKSFTILSGVSLGAKDDKDGDK